MSGLLLLCCRIRLRWTERAVDRPFSVQASTRVDVALVTVEGSG